MTPRRIISIIILIAVLCAIMAVLTICSQRDRIAGQKRDIAVAKTTGKALDKVVTDSTTIRTEQKAKENEVQTIPGSDTRLPDGYGADLQRVRDGKRH